MRRSEKVGEEEGVPERTGEKLCIEKVTECVYECMRSHIFTTARADNIRNSETRNGYIPLLFDNTR